MGEREAEAEANCPPQDKRPHRHLDWLPGGHCSSKERHAWTAVHPDSGSRSQSRAPDGESTSGGGRPNQGKKLWTADVVGIREPRCPSIRRHEMLRKAPTLREMLPGGNSERSRFSYLQSPRILASCVHTGAGGLLSICAMQVFSCRCIGG
jgi:hypothetical protein